MFINGLSCNQLKNTILISNNFSTKKFVTFWKNTIYIRDIYLQYIIIVGC